MDKKKGRPKRFDTVKGRIERSLMIDRFAEYLADGLTPSEAAFCAGAERADGASLLDALRRTVGLPQCK